MTHPTPDIFLIEVDIANQVEVQSVQRWRQRGRQCEWMRQGLAVVEEFLPAPKQSEGIVDRLRLDAVPVLVLARVRVHLLDQQQRARVAMVHGKRLVRVSSLECGLERAAATVVGLRPDEEIAQVLGATQ